MLSTFAMTRSKPRPLFELLEDGADGKKPHQGRDQGKAVKEQVGAEGEAVDARDGVEADGFDQEADQHRDDGLDHIAAAQRGHGRQAEHGNPEIGRRGKLQGDPGQGHAEEDEETAAMAPPMQEPTRAMPRAFPACPCWERG